MLLGLPRAARATRRTAPPPPHLAAFDAEAAAGERLDPDNAYFPLMRAVGLFAAHRDAEGLAAVHRAERQDRWREYLAEDVQSRWRLHEEAFGDDSLLRAGGCCVGHDAATVPGDDPGRPHRRLQGHAGRAGRAPSRTGWRCASSMRRVGDLMRVQSSFLIGSVIGVNVCRDVLHRPGGGPEAALPAGWPEHGPAPKDSQRRSTFTRLGTPPGPPGRRRGRQAETEASQQVLHLTQTDPASNDNVQALTRFSLLVGCRSGAAGKRVLGADPRRPAPPSRGVAGFPPTPLRLESGHAPELAAFALVLWGLILLVFLWNVA